MIYYFLLSSICCVKNNQQEFENTKIYQGEYMNEQKNEIMTVQMFLETVKNRILNRDEQHDFLAEAKSVNMTDGGFWYEYTEILRSLPPSNNMDLRPNGSLMAAEYASSRCYEFMPNIPGALAERILVLEMLTYGLGSVISTGFNPFAEDTPHFHQRFLNARDAYRAIVIDATQKIPEDPWFLEKKLQLEEDYGLGE